MWPPTGVGGAKGPEGWRPPKGLVPSWRVWGPDLNASLWVWGFGLFGFRKFDQNTGQSRFAKVGQHSETLKLAKVGLAKVGQAHDWPKSVKILAVGLAKVGHDPRTAFPQDRPPPTPAALPSPRTALSQDRPLPGPPSARPPKISRFFFPLPATIFIISSFSWVFS